jgi:hypothetical protein
MWTRSKLVLAGGLVALVLAVVVGSASANKLSAIHGGLWRAVFRPLKVVSGGVTAIACELTLEGSFHSGTIRKVSRALSGHITRSSLGACNIGTASVLRETLPWHLQYEGFSGVLPNITGIRLLDIGASYRLHEGIFGRSCLFRTSETEPAGAILELEAIEAGGASPVNSLKADEAKQISCGEIGTFSIEGRATVTEQPGGSRNVAVKLI